MFCPLLWVAKPEVEIGLSSEHDCLREKCAWWDGVAPGRCSLLSLVGALDLIAVRLMHIEDNIGEKEGGKI